MLHDITPGQSIQIVIPFDKYAVSFWQEDARAVHKGFWTAEVGAWTASLGSSASSRDVGCSAEFTVHRGFRWTGI